MDYMATCELIRRRGAAGYTNPFADYPGTFGMPFPPQDANDSYVGRSVKADGRRILRSER